MLSDNSQLPELFELFETGPMVKILFLFFYGLSRAGLKAFPALAAVFIQRPIGFERHIGQHRDQPESCLKLRVDEQVVPSYPPQAGQIAYFLMGEMSPLFFPVYNLGGRNRKSLEAEFLDI
jgi:hypothetical protein